jgi:hypothetical protein
MLYSDDQGRTWNGLDKPINAFPLNEAAYPFTVYEQDDGTLVLNAFGSKTAEECAVGMAGVVLYRSRDGGVTWGDPTVVVYGTPQNGYRFSENSFVVYPDETWVLFSRLHCRHRVHQWPLVAMRMISRDRGRTWTPPEQVFDGGGVPLPLILPDGGLVCATSHGVRFSYDRGRSWTEKDTYPNSQPIILPDGALGLIGGHYHWHWTKARILRPSKP